MTTPQKITLGALLTLMAIYLAYGYRHKIAPSLYAGTNQQILPNPQLTPGALNPDINQGNIDQNICNKNWSTKSIRPDSNYTTQLKRFQLDIDSQKTENGIKTTIFFPDRQHDGTTYYNGDSNLSNYEEDHLISLELGGSPTDIKNLWPESYLTTPNARDKDRVENVLHSMVCSKQITLVEAQRLISTNWVAEYNKLGLDKQTFGSIESLDVDDQ